MSPDLVRRFAELVAKPGTLASYLGPDNKKSGIAPVEAAFQSGRAYFVDVRATILAVDCDSAELVPVLGELLAMLLAEGLQPILVARGGEGRRHLFCLVLDPRKMRTYKEHISQLARGVQLQVRDTIRPPLSPHRLRLPVAMLYPTDPAEAIAALTPPRPKPLAPKWMTFFSMGP